MLGEQTRPGNGSTGSQENSKVRLHDNGRRPQGSVGAFRDPIKKGSIRCERHEERGTTISLGCAHGGARQSVGTHVGWPTVHTAGLKIIVGCMAVRNLFSAF